MTTLSPIQVDSQPNRRAGWTAARITSAIVGALLALCSLVAIGGGGFGLWADTAARDGGYVDFGSWNYRSSGYAVTSKTADPYGATGGLVSTSLLGTVRFRVTPATDGAPVFIGIAPAASADHYLNGVGYDTVQKLAQHQAVYATHTGGAPATAPADAHIWVAQVTGHGPQTLTWHVKGGDWTVVAMNADGSRAVNVRIDVAAKLPSLTWIAAGLLVVGVIVLIGGVALIVVPTRRARRRASTA